MSLLTEKQIEEIIDIATQQSEFAEILKLKLDHWNSNQTNQHFEPDWSKAPEGTDSVIIKSYWVNDGIWTFGENVTKYKRPTPVITPHPHAEIMAKYAEVAARRVDPWVEFEVRCEVKGWTRCGGFNGFHPDFEYRYIGDDK